RNADRRHFAYNRKLLGLPALRTHGALHTHNNTQLRGRNRHARPEQNYSPSRTANGRRGRRLGGGRRTRRAGASAAADAATHRAACAGVRQDHLTARLIGQWLSERLGQQFVIENRPGASSNIAAEAVVRAPADGYTLLMVGTAQAINATLYDKLNFHFIRDITPAAGIIRTALVVVAHPSFPAKTVPE